MRLGGNTAHISDGYYHGQPCGSMAHKRFAILVEAWAKLQLQLGGWCFRYRTHQKSQVRLIGDSLLQGATVGGEPLAPCEGYLHQPPQVGLLDSWHSQSVKRSWIETQIQKCEKIEREDKSNAHVFLAAYLKELKWCTICICSAEWSSLH
jgi:hypothetical protein